FHLAERVLIDRQLCRIDTVAGHVEAAFERGPAEHFGEVSFQLSLCLLRGRRGRLCFLAGGLLPVLLTGTWRRRHRKNEDNRRQGEKFTSDKHVCTSSGQSVGEPFWMAPTLPGRGAAWQPI